MPARFGGLFLLGLPMSEQINSAVIKVEIDAAGVEVGLRKIDDSAAKTGKSLESLGRSDGFSKLGAGVDGAAATVSGGAKKIAASIEKQISTMELGKRGTVEYYNALANQKGVNPAVLKPYLDQLDAVTRKTAEAAAAQRKADDGAKFIESLRAQNAEFGKTASQLAAMRAEQLGVSDAAGPLIAKMQESEEAAGGLGGALGITTGAVAAFVASLAGAVSVGAFVASISTSIDALADLDDMAQKTGSSVETLSRLQKQAQISGQDFGAVDAAIVKLARGMGGLDEDSNKVINALKRLGISTKDIANQDPSEVFIKAAKSLQGYADGAGKTALANDLIKGSGADLLPFLNDVADGVGKFSAASAASAANASAFNDNIALLKVRFGEIGIAIAANVLPSLLKFSEYIKDLIDSGKFKEWIDNAGAAFGRFAVAAEKTASVLVPLAQTAAVYFAIFVGVPAIVGAATAGLTLLYGAIGRVTVAFIAGSGSAGVFNTSLLGTSVAANVASGALTKMQVAGSALFAAFAGWQIGTYIYNEFSIVRIAGVRTFEALELGFENIKYYSALAFDAMSFAWNKTLGGMKVTFAGYVKSVADGLSVIGATDTSAQVTKYAESLRAAGAAQLSLAAKTVSGSLEMKKAFEATTKVIKQNAQDIVDYEMTVGRVVEATRGGPKAKEKPTLGVTLQKVKDDGSAAKALKDIADAYEQVLKVQAEYAAALGKTVAEANKEAEANEALVATFGMSKKAIAELEIVRMSERLERLRAIDMADDEVAALELVIAAKKRSAAAMGQVDGLEASKKANAEMAADWKKTVEKYDDVFRNGFADMLNNGKDGWKSFTKSLVTTFKTTVADQIYKMFAQPFVMKLVASLIGVTGGGTISGAAQAAGFGDAGGGGGGLLGVLSSAKSAYTAITAGFAGVTASISTGLTTLGGVIGSSTLGAFGTGLGLTGAQAATASAAYGAAGMSGTGSALTAGAATAPYITAAAGIAAGVIGGRMISGGYGLGGSGNGTVNAGTGVGGVVGAFFGGPIGVAIGSALGGMIGGVANRLFGRKPKEYGDTTLNGSFGANGFSGTSDTAFTQKGGLFRSDKSGVDKTRIDATTAQQFTAGYEVLKAASADFAKTLGINADSLKTRSQVLSIKLGKDQAENEKAVALFFTNVGNKIAKELVPSIASMAKTGEAASATLQRIAGNYAFVDVALEAIGKTFGAVGLGSVAARERLLDLVGGIETLGRGTAFFAQNFLSEAERLAPVAVKVKTSLADMGLAFVDTRDEFKSVVLGLDLTTESGAKTYASLMGIQEMFAAITPAAEAASNALGERIQLQKEYDDLTLTAAQKLAKARAATDVGNRGLFDQVQAARAAKSAQDAMRTSLNDVINKMRSFGESARDLGNGLKLGSLSTLTPEQQYGEAKRQYESTLAAAKGGDTKAQGDFSSIATAFLEASQKINGGDASYSADFAGVLTTSEEIAKWSAGQVDVAQASLEALNAQVSALGQLNATMQVVADGLTAGPAALINTVPRLGDMPNYAAMPAPDTARLEAAVFALQAEVAGLRAEQRVQTGDMIASNAAVTLRAAEAGIDGMEEVMTTQAWQIANRKAALA